MSIRWQSSSRPISYPEAIDFMHDSVQAIKNNYAPDLIWLLQHPPLFTCGRKAKLDKGINLPYPLFPTPRGGDITYHGPGQRTVYVMLNLKRHTQDVKKYIFFLEEWIIQTLANFSIHAKRNPGFPGVWVDGPYGLEKIASLGVHIQNWITSHGFSINVFPDLDPFQAITPCGIPDARMTSMQSILKKPLFLTEIDSNLKKTFPFALSIAKLKAGN